MGNIIGNNPQKWAANQVNLRQQLLGKTNQTPEILSWQTNKTAWIRAISAVQIDEKTAEELSGRQSMGGGKLAQEYVLFNGTVGLEKQTDSTDSNAVTYNQKTNSGVYSGPNPQTGINSSAYGFEYESSRGLVPMPGIEDLTISTYNRGSLRRASFKLKAYNKKQFAILDALFMRPGFTLLLEWGHTTYFKGTPEAPSYAKAKFNTRPFLILNDFLEGKDSENGQSEILSAIVKERGNGESGDGTVEDKSEYKVKGSQGNYDGFYGKITNFVWSLNPDGSYNIEVKAISTGDIIESLTIDRIEATQDAKPAEKKIQGLKLSSNENNTPSTYDLKGSDKYKGFTITVPYDDRVKYKEFWDEVGKDFTNGTLESFLVNGGFIVRDYAYYKGKYGGTNEFNKRTLKRSYKVSPEDPGPDILITNQDKSVLNGYLYSNYNYLKRNFQTLKSNISTNSENEKQTIGVLNTFDSSDKYKPEPDPNFSNLIMIQPKVVRDVLDANSGTVVNTVERLSQNAPYQYIELRRLLQFIEENLLIYNGGALSEKQKEAIKKGETPPEDEGGKKAEKILNLDIGTEVYMYTQPTQFSSDPNVCIIPFKFPTSKVDPGKDGKLNTDDDVITVDGNNITYFEKVLEGCSFRIKKSSHVADMLSIPVNLHYIGKVIKQVTSNNSVPLLKFLEQLLYGIQVALGSINKFSVTYDHDTNHIIFRDDVPLDPAVAPQTINDDDRVLFNVNGVKPNEENASFVNNVSISTTLSNKFATMISIGAQANTKSDIANSTSFGRWNAGLTDSITPSKLSKAGIESKNKTQNDPDRLWKRSVASLNKKPALLTSFYKEGKIPTGDVQSTAQSQNANYNKYIATTERKNSKGGLIPSTQGFIPFSMNLDMDGFSGLRIYEKFYITTEILPPSYPRTLSFLCKGITHTINNSGWKTKIDSLTVTSVDTLDENGNLIKLSVPPNEYNPTKYEIE